MTWKIWAETISSESSCWWSSSWNLEKSSKNRNYNKKVKAENVDFDILLCSDVLSELTKFITIYVVLFQSIW